MKTLTCPVCGKTFETHARNAVYCSKKCQNKGYYERCCSLSGADAISASAPVSFDTLSKAKTKPANTSAVRWRMELRRRATAKQYGRKCIWDCRPDPDLLH